MSDASVSPEVADEMPEVDCPCLPMDWGCPLCVLDDSAYITSNTRPRDPGRDLIPRTLWEAP